MEITLVTSLIVSLVALLGGSVLLILSASTTLGVAYLAFRFGWGKLRTTLPVGDSLHRSAIARGRILNRRDNILQ